MTEKIKEILFRYSQIDGEHHKAWVIDQIARIILKEEYENFIYEYENLDENGNELADEEKYCWNIGIAP